MKAAYVTDKEKIEIRQIDVPDIKDNEVLIKVMHAGVCGSDLHFFRGTHAFRKPPAILGHEVAGKIVKIGSSVTRFAVGDRVTVEPLVGCGQCEFCAQELINICEDKTVPGTPQWIGTFVEYFPAPECTVYKLADSVTYALGTIIEPLAVAVHAMRRVSSSAKDTLVIFGSGTIGLLTLVVAREYGYKNILCTDTVQFNLDMAMKMGAALALNPLTDDVPAKILEFTGGKGADVAIIAAGAPNIITQASQCVKKRGEISLVAMITKEIPVYVYDIVCKEQNLFGSQTYVTSDFKEACDRINGGLDLTPFITQVFPLDESQKALDVLSQKKENVVKILVATGAS